VCAASASVTCVRLLCVSQKVKPLKEKNEKCVNAIRVLIQKLERHSVDVPADITALLETE
jgi:hypothetical protein